jgi:hypothetical protein
MTGWPGDLGEPVSYLTLARRTPVLSADGVEVGRVRRVLAARAQDVFHGLLVDTPAGDRVVAADEVAELWARGVVLRLDAAAAGQLRPRAADPAARPANVLEALDDLAANLWRRLSGRGA